MPRKAALATVRILAAAPGAALLMIGCASSQVVPLDVPSEVSWSFAGSVEAAHYRQSGPQRFREPVHGVVEFLPEVIVVSASHGTCTVKRSDVRVRTGRVRISCGKMLLALGMTDGEVTVPVQQESEVRADCARYSDRTASRTCVEWNYRVETRVVRISGPVQVFQSNTP
jgi:hypothetical protein